MFTMAKIKDRSTEEGMIKNSNYLDVHLIHNDYYSEKDTVQGEWYGQLAEHFNLQDEIIKEGNKAFEQLRKNINPLTGEKLTPRNRNGGIRYFDFQCSAQKSVSIMAMALNDKRLIEAHRNAFFTAMKEFEKFAACRDNSSFGFIKEPITTDNIIAGVFHHDTSRALDPQLHTHCVVSNLTYDPVSKRYVALETCNIVKAIRFLGKVYQNQLAINVQKCGYDIELKHGKTGDVEGFEIVGVPETVLKLFSKRRQDIETEIEKFELESGRKPTSAEIHIITKLTRDRKMVEITAEKLRKGQIAQLSDNDHKRLMEIKKEALSKQLKKNYSYLNNNDKINSSQSIFRKSTPSFEHKKGKSNFESSNTFGIVNYAIGNLYQRKSVLNKHSILAEAINRGLGKVNLEKLISDVDNHEELVKLVDNNENPYLSIITTVSGMQLEQRCVNIINQGIDKYDPVNKHFSPFSDSESIRKETEENYKFENHKKIIKEILSTTNRYHVLQGVAGSGKTTALQELQKGLVEGGQKNIHYVAPTKSAVKAIFDKVTEDTMTLQKFFVETRKNNLPIKNGYLVIDESSLKSNVDGAKVLDIAEKNNMRVLFVGDIKQHKSVDAGDFLRIIQEYSKIGVSKLDDIVRQKGIYKKAVQLMSSGAHHEGLQIIDKELGWVNECKGEYLKRSALQYLEYTENGKKLDKCIGIAPTHKECDKITEILRDELKSNKVLGEPLAQKEVFTSFDWTQKKRTNIQSYQKGLKIHINIDHNGFIQNEIVTIDRIQNKRLITTDGRTLAVTKSKNYDVGEVKEIELSAGDKIQFKKGDIVNNIINGEIATVKAIDTKGNILTEEGKTIPPDFKCFKHGYFITSHKSQGLDVDYAVIAGQYLNKDSLYVGTSRGKKACSLFVPETERLYHQISATTNRTAALDVLQEIPQTSKCLRAGL